MNKEKIRELLEKAKSQHYKERCVTLDKALSLLDEDDIFCSHGRKIPENYCQWLKAAEAEDIRLGYGHIKRRECDKRLLYAMYVNSFKPCPDCQLSEQADRLIEEKVGETRHPEDYCHICGFDNIVWYADNDLWNKVMDKREEICCPVCFVKFAESKGIRPTAWRLSVEGDCFREQKQLEEKCNKKIKDTLRTAKND